MEGGTLSSWTLRSSFFMDALILIGILMHAVWLEAVSLSLSFLLEAFMFLKIIGPPLNNNVSLGNK